MNEIFFKIIMNQVIFYQNKELYSGRKITECINFLLALIGVYIFIVTQFIIVLNQLKEQIILIYLFLLFIAMVILLITCCMNKVLVREWKMMRFCRRQERLLLSELLKPLKLNKKDLLIKDIIMRRLKTIHDDDKPELRERSKKNQLVITSMIFSFYGCAVIFLSYQIILLKKIVNIECKPIGEISIFLILLGIFISIAIIHFQIVKPVLEKSEI
jgi:hypothetical protein